MKSLYFDDSLYENEMHFKISKMLDECESDDEAEEIRIMCDNEEEYNSVLDALYHAGKDTIKVFGVTNNPMEIIVEKDPREGYRKFNEEQFLVKEADDK